MTRHEGWAVQRTIGAALMVLSIAGSACIHGQPTDYRLDPRYRPDAEARIAFREFRALVEHVGGEKGQRPQMRAMRLDLPSEAGAADIDISCLGPTSPITQIWMRGSELKRFTTDQQLESLFTRRGEWVYFVKAAGEPRLIVLRRDGVEWAPVLFGQADLASTLEELRRKSGTPETHFILVRGDEPDFTLLAYRIDGQVMALPVSAPIEVSKEAGLASSVFARLAEYAEAHRRP